MTELHVDRLERRLRSDEGPTLVAYLTAGLPSRSAFADLLRSVADVVDAVEVGVPFSDPMADGPTIQAASRRALEGGVTLPWILELLSETEVSAPVVLMGYLNPFLAYGLAPLLSDASAAGVAGFIVPDLPLEESDEFRSLCDAHGCGLIQMVTPVTPAARRQRLRSVSRGFTYAVTVNGVTGGQASLPPSLTDMLRTARGEGKSPLMAGFGIRTRQQVEALSPCVDGVIVGSAVLECIERGDDPAALLASLR